MNRTSLAALLVLQACATTSAGTGGDGSNAAREDPFPSREDVARIAEKPIAGPIFGERELVTLETYSFTPPAVRADGPWFAAFQTAAASRAGLITASDDMGCIAAGIGQFLLEHKALPAYHLGDFIHARCASSSIDVGYRYLTLTFEGAQTEETLHARFRESWEKLVQEQVAAAGGLRVGHVWFGQSKDRAVALIATGQRRVHLTQISGIPDAKGNVSFEGELLEPAGRYQALINHGRFAAKECEQDSSLPMPRFRITCPTSSEDATTWIELNAYPAGQVLGNTVFRMLAYPKGTPVDTYERHRFGAAPAGDDTPSPETAFLRLLNAHRGLAKLRPLMHADAQSELSRKLAPHYFASSYGSSHAAGEARMVAERIVLGLLAGWDVSGVVRDGRMTSQYFPTRDTSELLEIMLARPSGRSVLMTDEHSHVALGAVSDPSGEGLAILATTYALFEVSQLSERTNEVYQQLAKLRRDRGIAPLMAIEGGKQAVLRAVEAVQNGRRDPERALNDLLSSTAARVQLPARGWMMEASRIEDLRFPEELLTEPTLGVELAVAYRREAGQAWGRYIVMMVAVKPESMMQQASLDASSSSADALVSR